MSDAGAARPQLERRFGVVEATALNMSNMVGIGPFLTIPLLMTALNGPLAMLGWAVAVLIVVPDGMVWSELAASMPGSGGSYLYLREGYGRESWGRLAAFLFVWQFVLSGPLEIASGYIGFSRYFGYLWPGLRAADFGLLAAAVGVLNVFLLYRHIESVSRLTVALWIGTLLTTGIVIATGAVHFSAKTAFALPPGSFRFSLGFLMGLGAGARIGVYDYLGYYDICYIGEEVRDPGRVIPRSIFWSILAVAAIYVAINLSIMGVVPWHEFVPAVEGSHSDYIVSIFMERIYGPRVAALFTVMVLWTAFASVFALLLGYSRIPYAAAQDGYFFKAFARLHPRGNFPYVSLLVIGAVAIACSFFSLGLVIDAVITTRILVQFIGQIGAVTLLRKRAPEAARPYKMWLYPLPSLVALAGWTFLFGTSEPRVIALGLLTLGLGVLLFFVWSWRIERWPFAVAKP